MERLLLLVGVAVAVFVGFNVGDSSTGVAFGPAVGSGVLSKLGAAGLMAAFALLGGWTVGRNVVATMGGEIVPRGCSRSGRASASSSSSGSRSSPRTSSACPPPPR